MVAKAETPAIRPRARMRGMFFICKGPEGNVGAGAYFVTKVLKYFFPGEAVDHHDLVGTGGEFVNEVFGDLTVN